MSLETTTQFINWLDAQEERRGWTDNKLAVNAGISPSVITRARQGILPQWEACKAIASALQIPPEEVFRRAGLLSPKPAQDERRSRFEAMLDMLPDDDVDELYDFARMKLERKAKLRGI